jgi:hypothetical protein
MKKQVKRVYTLSLYNFGRHSFNKNDGGNPSFGESMCGLWNMIEVLYNEGYPWGPKSK